MTVAPPQLVLGDNNVWPLRLDASEGGGWLLIDAGFDAAAGEVSTWEVLVEQAIAAGVTPEDVRVVVVTHEHIDLAGLAARWAALGAPVLIYILLRHKKPEWLPQGAEASG